VLFVRSGFLVDLMAKANTLLQMSSIRYRYFGAVFSRRFWTFALAIVTLGFVLPRSPGQSAGKDDVYLEAFQLIQQGDALQKAGDKQGALRKYQKAESSLQGFRQTYPDFGLKMVAFRLSYVADKIALCSDKPAADNSKAAQPQTATAAAAAGPVKLLNAGAEPRTMLRLHPKAGDQQKLGLSLKMAMEMQVGGMQGQAIKVPAFKMPMDIAIKSVSPEGDITYEMVMGEPGMAEEGGGPAADAIKNSLASLKGLTGTGTISSRGILKSSEVKAVPGADPNLKQAMDQMKESFSQMATPFPEEAVGPGAKWEVTKPMKSQGMNLNQTTTYELVSIDGDHVTAKDSFVQSASNQKIQSPAMPGMKIDLTKMNGRGTGEMQLDLAQLLPSMATVDSHSDFTMGMDAGGQKQTMNMKLDLNLRFEAQ
jgi:Family of unknown function (DUF6263)